MYIGTRAYPYKYNDYDDINAVDFRELIKNADGNGPCKCL